LTNSSITTAFILGDTVQWIFLHVLDDVYGATKHPGLCPMYGNNHSGRSTRVGSIAEVWRLASGFQLPSLRSAPTVSTRLRHTKTDANASLFAFYAADGTRELRSPQSPDIFNDGKRASVWQIASERIIQFAVVLMTLASRRRNRQQARYS
jgi:hypothetical protein